MDYQLRLFDLLSKFDWNDGVVENLTGADAPNKRYAVVSESFRDYHEHWIDGFADTWEGAASIVGNIDNEWRLVGVYDLDGEPGTEISVVPVRVAYEVGDLSAIVGRYSYNVGYGVSAPVGTYDVEWAREIFEDEKGE